MQAVQVQNRLVTMNPVVTPPAILPWEDLTQFASLNAAVLQVAQVYNFQEHPYLQWMQAVTTSREAFRLSQLPFRFAVESFSQALAAVLARVPTLEMRLPLAGNVAEEHGHGNCWQSHKYTFQQYLQALGATVPELEHPCPISVLAFNQSILGYCLTQPFEAGAALLGMMEYSYIGVSAAIAQTIHQRSWTVSGSQSHYAVHEKLDIEHARDLLQLAELGWSESRSRAQIAQALLLGAHYFWTLYDDLQPTV